ncbi:MAG: efflux RND transporter periplasmic adaptor subunit [Patescibacteria group bacterium]|nr:efflux RND transporter periplasmic adaptor subunit [Patescibacteria group bacterium]
MFLGFIGVIKKKRFIFLFLILIIIGISAFWYFANLKKTPLQSATVKRGDLKQELSLSGKVDADEHVILQFQTAGKLNWIGVKTGDRVKKYQALASLDKEKLLATLRQYTQDFTAAKAASEKVYDSLKGVTSETFDQKISRTAADATQNKAYDYMRSTEEDLKNSVLYSPIEGLITSVQPKFAGVNSTALEPAKFEVVNPKTIFFDVNADQSEVILIHEGQSCTIVFDSYSDEKTNCVIKNISFAPKADETETVYRVRIEFENLDYNNDYKYRLGMTGDANFITNEKDGVLYLPSKFIKSDDQGKYVLVGKDKKKTYVQTGMETDTDVEVTGGLNEGDIVYD